MTRNKLSGMTKDTPSSFLKVQKSVKIPADLLADADIRRRLLRRSFNNYVIHLIDQDVKRADKPTEGAK